MTMMYFWGLALLALSIWPALQVRRALRERKTHWLMNTTYERQNPRLFRLNVASEIMVTLISLGAAITAFFHLGV